MTKARANRCLLLLVLVKTFSMPLFPMLGLTLAIAVAVMSKSTSRTILRDYPSTLPSVDNSTFQPWVVWTMLPATKRLWKASRPTTSPSVLGAFQLTICNLLPTMHKVGKWVLQVPIATTRGLRVRPTLVDWWRMVGHLLHNWLGAIVHILI